MRKPSSAVEKAAPGAKRILSGMVADTLALVLATKAKFYSLDVWYQVSHGYFAEMLIKSDWNEKHIVKIYSVNADAQLNC